MTVLRFHQIGYITDGEMKSFYVKMIDDRENSGGYYLLFSKDFNNLQAEGYDEWYLHFNDLQHRMNELQIEPQR